jgi:predicted nuclease of predicted toxin-antitoxin system
LKLLLDQNLSHRLLPALDKLFPGSTHTSREGLARADDHAIWDFAKRGDYVLVTQDADFYERVLLLGPPPKVIWLRCGNTSTAHVEQLLIQQQAAIQTLGDDPATGCLEIF